MKILTELEQLGLPVTRIHTDSGTDFVSPQMRRLATRLHLKHTCSAPEEHNSNGRIENIVRRIKGQMRIHLHSVKGEMHLWPLAARAASASWRSQVLREMGMPLPTVVPFGTNVQVLARTWRRRAAQKSLTLRATSATVMCPAALIKQGYVVRVGRRLSVVTRLFQGEDPPVKAVIPERDEPPVAYSIGPEARITTKSSIPDMSYMPGPRHRHRAKSPGPGRVPILDKLQVKLDRVAEDSLAQDMCNRGELTLDEAIAFVLNSSYITKESNSGQRDQAGCHHLFGACNTEDGGTITRYCSLRPGMAAMLVFIARKLLPKATFATNALGVNTATYPTSQAGYCAPNTPAFWIPLCMPEKGSRLWTEIQQGSRVTGIPGVMIKGGQNVPGQFHDVVHTVQFAPDRQHGTEAWDRQHPRVSLLLYTPNGFPSLVAEQVRSLITMGFPVSNEHGKGGDHPKQKNCLELAVEEKKQDSVVNSSKPHSHGIPRVEGPGEGHACQEEYVVSSSEPHSHGIPRVEGPGEGHVCQQDSVVSSSRPHSPGIPQVDGPKEGFVSGISRESSETGTDPHSHTFRVSQASCHDRGTREHFCRICEDSKHVGANGMCAYCGCRIGLASQFSMQGSRDVQHNLELASRGTQNPKNGITQKYKNCILKNPKQDGRSTVKANAHGVGIVEQAQSWHDVEAEAAKVGVKKLVAESKCMSGGCSMFVTTTEVAGERTESKTSTIRAVGLQGEAKMGSPNIRVEGSGRDDPEVVDGMCDWLLCEDWLDVSAPADGPSKQGSEEADEGVSVDVVRLDSVVTDELEELKLLEAVDDKHQTQREICDYTRWLDECQLRLATAHQDEIEAWIEEGTISDEDGSGERHRLQKIWHDMEDIRQELRSLRVEQTTSDMQALAEAVSSHSPEEAAVLQTRILSNAQVMAEWDLWEPATQVELDGLIHDKEALECTTQQGLEIMKDRGHKITLIPSKVIYSVKAPCGRRKCRLVACGNFLAAAEDSRQEHRQVVYTASIGIESLRTGLSFSTRRGHTLLTLDIKAAFLNASILPRNRQAAEAMVEREVNEKQVDEDPKEIVALIPLRLLITKGVLAASSRLIVRKAVYGLDQAPRDWGMLRDSKLPTLRIQCRDKTYHLFRSFAEDCMWLISAVPPYRGFEASARMGGHPEIEGWAAIYVDDIMIAADHELAYAVADAIRSCWECSAPQEVGADGSGPVRFLGMDLYWDGERNLTLSQESYIKELGNRYSAELKDFGRPSIPLSGSFKEDVVEDGVTYEQTRKAQALVEELLWTSIRCRPDISYAVSKLASTIAKAPRATYQVGLRTLAYLTATSDVTLTYWKKDRAIWEQYKRCQDLKACVEGYGDASFAPEARRSMQSMQIYAEGNLVAWAVNRQAFMAQSSCEAEMVALMDLANYTISASYLAEELYQRKAEKQLAGDNVAALAIYGGTAVHWRTRHLRIKAKAFLEKYSEGALPAHHVSGEWNASDIGTKALPAARHWKLCNLLGLRGRLNERVAIRRVQTKGQELDQCLRAVLLACCLCTVQGQPQPQPEEANTDRLLGFVVFLIMVATVAVWEATKHVYRMVMSSCCSRSRAREAPEREILPQPDDEDELEEAPILPLNRPPRDLSLVRRPQRVIDEERQARFEEGLRQRGARVYQPEPDQEPRAEAQNMQEHQEAPVAPEDLLQPAMVRYLDDAVAVIPAERAQEREEEEPCEAFGPPPPAPRVVGQGEQRPLVRDYQEVRTENIRREAERRGLDLPPYPLLIVNPDWGPAPNQPPVRYLQTEGTASGGETSALHHLPPNH